MIDTQELRLGNYLKKIKDIVKVTSFSHSLISVTIVGTSNQILCLPLELEPISLTEDILLKCGFEKDDTGVDMFDPDYAEWYQMEFPVIGILCQSSDKKYLFDENTDTLRIQYLHQLQNLFFDLTGEELEVEL